MIVLRTERLKGCAVALLRLDVIARRVQGRTTVPADARALAPYLVWRCGTGRLDAATAGECAPALLSPPTGRCPPPAPAKQVPAASRSRARYRTRRSALSRPLLRARRASRPPGLTPTEPHSSDRTYACPRSAHCSDGLPSTYNLTSDCHTRNADPVDRGVDVPTRAGGSSPHR